MFDSRFCNCAKGNEKGAVENLVGYVRRNALVPDLGWTDWDELNEHLRTWCEAERLKHKDKWEQEKVYLRKLPDKPFSSSTIKMAVVSSSCLVAFDRNHYSVPSQYVGQTVSIHAFWHTIQIYLKGKLIAEHTRSYDTRKSFPILEHYLPILEKKPRAAQQAVVVRQLGPLWDKVRKFLIFSGQDNREFVKILCLFKEFSADDVTNAAEQALAQQHVSALYIRQILLKGNDKNNVLSPPVNMPIQLSEYRPHYPDLRQYDSLARKGALH